MVSDHSETVVCLDTGEVSTAAAAEMLTDFLVARNIITVNLQRDDLMQPSAWRPGASWLSVLEPDPAMCLNLANDGVDIVTERAVHHPVENYEPPTCIRCATSYDEEAHHATIEPWLAGTEPVLTCSSCNWSALAGDWPATWTFAIGAPAVVFHNWPRLTDRFLGEVRMLIGGRTQVVRAHY